MPILPVMRRLILGTATGALILTGAPVLAAEKSDAPAATGPNTIFKDAAPVITAGTVTIKGQKIDYTAISGTIVVHPEHWDDTAWRAHPAKPDDTAVPDAEASMFYVAYVKKGVPAASRPITFLFNGGPGSASVWLHMGAFGPRRVVTRDDSHTPAAPYDLIDNDASLLDASDVVFIDAPGTGFSRVAGKDKEKAFWGMDADAHAFTSFIQAFLTRHGRWNSPKYLFGESYGTPRAAMIAARLTVDHAVDLNGVILLSQILNYNLSADGAVLNPGTDQPYITTLPTYAATAWYHNRLPGTRPADIEPFLKEAESFAIGDYASALQQGSLLDPGKRRDIAERMAKYIGLPVDYILKSDLRIEGGQFTQALQIGSGLITGRLDSRFSGPAIDVLNKEADYDPQSAAISSAYISAFNAYARDTLHYGQDETYKPDAPVGAFWNYDHRPPGQPEPVRGIINVMPDIAYAMKYNPQMKVLVTGGYYDLATPYYEGWYEMHHLPIPASLQSNIAFRYFRSGHMVYANTAALHDLHDAVAGFIAATDNLHK
ncbi:peptidase S10 [Novosphingobium sp.]|uniref:S10 family peptidase n=1 Tax=Novosphingobium sp. TaxID=1874826 RepID=UPI00333F88A4